MKVILTDNIVRVGVKGDLVDVKPGYFRNFLDPQGKAVKATKENMAELEKMNKIIDKQYPEATKETILILDATTGKNAISQVEEFKEVTDITGIILTKMDGTAKGGIAVTIADEYDMPIKFLGIGEKKEDLEPFNAKAFAEEVFDE